MKKYFVFTLLLFIPMFSAISVFSQYYNPPDVIGYSIILYDDNQPQLVSGFAGTELYFFYELYPWEDYDPWIHSSLYRTDNPENVYSEGTIIGYRDILPASGQHPTFYAQSGYTYCVFSDHRYVFYEWVNYPYTPRVWVNSLIRVGYTQACHTFPYLPTPMPTPTPTPPSCEPLGNGFLPPCPTRTPTPVPTPTVKITEVGFTGDRKIRQFEVSGQPYIDEPDGTTTTWRSEDNPRFPVAYLKGTSPTLFAKFSIMPTLTTSQSAQIRIKKGNTVVTASPIDVKLVGSEIRVDSITIPFSNLESGEFVRKSEYEFTWQISFDNGGNWRDLNKKSKHDIHWLNSNPPNEANFKPFINSNGTEYQGLFDKALEWTTGKVNKNELDIQKVIQRINSTVAGELIYKPERNSYSENPLGILNGENRKEAVCQDHALILSGLLKSIGIIGVQEKYHWGGDETSSKRNYYCPPEGCGTITTDSPVGSRITMQTKRDRLGCLGFGECVSENPSFTYHATVIFENRSFDPSYGIVQSGVELLTAVNVPSVGQPQCVHRAAATALRVSRDTFGNPSLAANNNTNKICSPIPSSIYSGAKLFRFDGLGGADIAVVRGSTGEWVIQDEFQTETSLFELEYNPNQDALAPADYDGDGLTDPAVWYSDGYLSYRMSANYYKQTGFFWHVKTADEKAVPGDYDGDQISDIAAWRASDGIWIIHRSSSNTNIEIQWGIGSLGDVPVPGDYDGDGKTDIAIWRRPTGDWWVLKSSDGSYTAFRWGATEDIPVQGDYDGDGTTDYAVVRPSTGGWYLVESENGYQYRAYPGPVLTNDDIPVPADYNADSKTDFAIWFKSSGMWHIVDSQTGEIRQDFLGQPGDTPVISASVFR